jgi:hypothetical protein
MGFPFLFALCSAASIVIWFVDIEKGRENCRIYVEERKLIRVAKEAGLTTEEVVQGVATGHLGVATEGMAGSASETVGDLKNVDIMATGKELDE